MNSQGVTAILIVNNKVLDDISKAGKAFKCQILKLSLQLYNDYITAGELKEEIF